jgi:hypothetical protein
MFQVAFPNPWYCMDRVSSCSVRGAVQIWGIKTFWNKFNLHKVIYNTKVIFLHSLLYLDTISNAQPTFYSIFYTSL